MLGYRARPLGEIIERLNGDTLVIAMLETPEGIANAAAIAAVPGIDMLLIGSNDLCTGMGIPGQLNHPRLREAYGVTAAACRAQGKVLGVGGIRDDIALQTDLVRMGARFMIAGDDVSLLLAAATREVAALRKIDLRLRRVEGAERASPKIPGIDEGVFFHSLGSVEMAPVREPAGGFRCVTRFAPSCGIIAA